MNVTLHFEGKEQFCFHGEMSYLVAASVSYTSHNLKLSPCKWSISVLSRPRQSLTFYVRKVILQMTLFLFLKENLMETSIMLATSVMLSLGNVN